MAKTNSIKKSKPINLLILITSTSAVLGGIIGFIACVNYLSSARYSLSSIIQYMFSTWGPWVLTGIVIGGAVGFGTSFIMNKLKK